MATKVAFTPNLIGPEHVDPTPWLCIPEALRFMASLLPGGWPEVMTRNRALALQARSRVLESLRIEAPCPPTMIGSMASVPLPPAAQGSVVYGLDYKSLHAWFRERGVETWLHTQPIPVLRISAQLYNDMQQFERLADLLVEALRGS